MFLQPPPFLAHQKPDTAHIAYKRALEQSLPHFGGENGVCKNLDHLIDGEEEEGVENRWRPLFQSGCGTGHELSKAWDHLQKEATESCQYLEEELSGHLRCTKEGIGESAVDGFTRSKMSVEMEMEKRRAAVLKKAMANHQDLTARPVWSWKQIDKLSTAFLLNIPGAHSSLSSPIFTEALA